MKFSKTTIDGHLHIESWFDKNGKSFMELYDSVQENLGLKAICVSALADNIHGGPDDVIMAAFYKLHTPTAYANGGFVYPQYPVCPPLPDGMDPLTQYNELMEIGFDGIKILYKPDVTKAVRLPINDGFYEPMFSAAEKDKTPFMWHLADPAEFWEAKVGAHGGFGDGSYYSFEEHFYQAFDVIKRHPNLRVTFAHFLFLAEDPESLEKIFEKFPEVFIDVTPGTEMYDTFTEKSNFYREFFKKHNTRILYGTDGCPTRNPSSEKLMQAVYKALTTSEMVNIWGHNAKGLELPDEISENILYKNFMGRYGSKPKPINKAALKRYIEKYSPLITKESEKIEILKAAKEL